MRDVRTLGVVVIAAACCVLVGQPAVAAANVEWRVVLSSSNTDIVLPQLPSPAHGHSFQRAGLADGGAGLLGFGLKQSDGPDGLWQQQGSTVSPYAQIGSADTTGPGRNGTESNDVFRRLYSSDSIGAGVRAFGASANDPSAPAGDASTGIWLWDGTKNVEIARVGSDGVLGPDLGSGMTYKSLHHVNDTTNPVNVWMLPNRRVLFAGSIASGAGLGSDGLSVYTPGVGNHPCMLQGTIDAEFGPGVNAAEFDFYYGMSVNKAISPRGEVFAMGSIGPTSASPTGWSGAAGIWQFCDGAPKLAVLTKAAGHFGPGLPDQGAVFGGDNHGLFSYIAPSLPGSFYFTSGGRMSTAPGAATFLGLFFHDATQSRNRPILLNGSEGTYGPQIPGYAFNPTTVPFKVKGAGQYAVVQTLISPTGNPSSTISGVWRIAATGLIEPVAISADTGAYAPAPGRTWNGTYYAYAVFDNGDIVMLADTRNVSDGQIAASWWRLSRGAVPVEILKVGDLVQVPTPTGLVSAPVTKLDTQLVSGLPPTAGRDTWFSANGTVLMEVTIQGFSQSTTLISGMAVRTDYLFSDSFD